MKKKPLVSIVIPCYNASKSLDRAISSLLKQTYPFFEIIAIDDGSEDNTRDILLKWAEIDKRLKPFFLPHRGIVFALNFGLYVSRGDLIARMDSDDISHKKRIELQVIFLQENPSIDLSGTQVSYVGNSNGFREYVKWQNFIIEPFDVENYRFLEMPIAHPTFMFRRSLVERTGGYLFGPFPEDYEFLLRIIDLGFRVAKIPKKLLVWKDWKGRVSRRSFTCHRYGFTLIKVKYLSRFFLKQRSVPTIGILGWGKCSKEFVDMLHKRGFPVSYIFFYKSHPENNYKGIPILPLNEIPHKPKIFLLVFGGSIKRIKRYECFLAQKGYIMGQDFLICG